MGAREWFLHTGPMLSWIRYRALKAVKVADKRAFEGKALGWFQAYLAVENAVDDPLEQPMGKFKVKTSEQGADVAGRVRAQYKFSRRLPCARCHTAGRKLRRARDSTSYGRKN